MKVNKAKISAESENVTKLEDSSSSKKMAKAEESAGVSGGERKKKMAWKCKTNGENREMKTRRRRMSAA